MDDDTLRTDSEAEDASAVVDVETLADADTLAELRELLVGPERRDLDELREKFASSRAEAADIAALLPQAIALREQEDDQLARALAPTVEGAIQTSVKANPQPMIDAVFPVIGPAIRKAVSEALASAVQSLNQTLEHSLSVRSLKWRIEAARTGKPFAEVVLLHTLRYRVEQVFLIHPESGLLMRHVAAEGVEPRDSQLVSGMFSAITDFVRDSFETDEQIGLQTMQVGGVSVWIERGPHAVLAGAVRGSAPAELREVFQEVVEDLHRQHGETLESFAGDDSDLADAEPTLRRCLVSAAQPGAKRKVSPALLIFAAVALGLLGWGLFAAVSSSLRWSDYIERLETMPGVMLVDHNHNWWGASSVRGLVSPAGVGLPAAILAESGIDEDDVQQRWERYPLANAMPPPPVVQEPPRVPVVKPSLLELATSLLDPPATVTLRTEGGVVIAEGEASRDWIAAARQSAEVQLGGWGAGYRDEGVVDLDTRRELAERAGRIESAVIRMPEGSTLDLASQGEAHGELVRNLAAARDLAQRLGLELVVVITGHTDGSGDAAGNLRLSEARAEAVAEDFRSRFQPPITTVVRGVGSAEPIVPESASAEEQKQNRRVTFGVELRDPTR